MTINVGYEVAQKLRRALDDEGIEYVLIPPSCQLNKSFGYVFELKGYVKLEITKRCWSLYANCQLVITLPNYDSVNCLCAW